MPELPVNVAHVWWAGRGVASSALLGVLDEGERGRWGRLRQAADRDRYAVAHALLRLVLGGYLGVPATRVRLTATCRHCGGPHGKPRLDSAHTGAPDSNLEFSLSHSGDRVVVAVTRGVPVGVDVEQVRDDRVDASVARLALSDPEREVLRRLPAADQPAALLRYWTRKEAILKATGDGLAVPPGSLTVTAPDQPPALVAWTAEPAPAGPVHLTDLGPGAGHLACLATMGTSVSVAEWSGEHLL